MVQNFIFQFLNIRTDQNEKLTDTISDSRHLFYTLSIGSIIHVPHQSNVALAATKSNFCLLSTFHVSPNRSYIDKLKNICLATRRALHMRVQQYQRNVKVRAS